MQNRALGKNGLLVAAMGYGCMGLTGVYGTPPDRKKAVEVTRQAAEHGYGGGIRPVHE